MAMVDWSSSTDHGNADLWNNHPPPPPPPPPAAPGPEPSNGMLQLNDLKTIIQDRIKDLDPNASLVTLLSTAETALKDSTDILEFDQNRRDLAYVQYILAYEVATALIPNHPDFEFISSNLNSRYNAVLKSLNQNEPIFFKIKQEISSGGGSSSLGSHLSPHYKFPSHSHSRSQSQSQPYPVPQNLSPASQHSRSRSTSVHSTISVKADILYPPPAPSPYDKSSSSIGRSGSQRRYSRQLGHTEHPGIVSPDYSNHRHTNSAHFDPPDRHTDHLAARFANLRTSGHHSPHTASADVAISLPPPPPPPPPPSSQPYYQTETPPTPILATATATATITTTAPATSPYMSAHDVPIRVPTPNEFHPGYHSDDFSVHDATQTPYPPAPYQQPASAQIPRVPPKLPLSPGAFAGYPKQPSPTYSPGRGLNLPRDPSLRHLPRNSSGLDSSFNSLHMPLDNPDQAYAGPDTSHLSDLTGQEQLYYPPDYPSARGSWPADLSISAEKLYDYLRLFNILVIDVRERAEFDYGHIFGSSVVCIEPSMLHFGITAEQIQDALEMSPERERNLFYRRDTFALVVYYDSTTKSVDFLSRAPQSRAEEILRTLYDALTVLNPKKPLQKPPALLEGGIEAWANLLGFQSLLSTKSPASRSSNAARAASLSAMSAEASLHVKKRRREFNPLGPEEERKWHERARSESLALESSEEHHYYQSTGAPYPTYEEHEYYRKTKMPGGYDDSADDFNKRYPAADDIPGPPTPPLPHYPSMPTAQTVSRPPPAIPRVSHTGVHERNLAHMHERPAINLPNPTYTHTPQNTLLPTTGLVNFGATCYMNSIVQCLSGTIRLSRMFRDHSYKQYLQRNNWKGSKGLIAEHFANLIQHMWKGEADAVKPTTFRGFCARLNSEWGTDTQQDAKEFFDFVLDYLHEDLNVNWDNPPPHVLSAQEEERRERMGKAFASKIEWARYTKRDESLITNLFAGQHASLLRCRTCGCTSTTYETFFSVSVEIPASGRTTLSRCLRSYCAEERLSGEEVWRCPRCRHQREATKQIFFTRAPEIFVVHFKRFSAGHEQSARKIHSTIEFPIEDFDLGEFMIPPPSIEEISKNQRDRGSRDCTLPREMTPPYRYNAFAVVRHIGQSMTKGHYTAVVRDPARQVWREFNDAFWHNVRAGSGGVKDALQTPEAYLVFYERVHV